MGRVKIPYYVVKRNGRGFWQPTAAMRSRGFGSVPCGPDGPEAWRRAQAAYERWRRHLLGQPDLPSLADLPDAAETFPAGSVGEAWQRYTRSPEWARKALTTRNKVWWPAWRLRIRPVFGDVDPRTITVDDLSRWRVTVEATAGASAAHKAMVVWRAFWNVMRAMRYVADSDPSLAIRNSAPAPRRERWTEGEIVRLTKAAIRQGWPSLACVIAAIWDTSFQPGDVRTLRAKHLTVPDAAALWFDRGREKTGAAAIGTVSRRTDRLIRAYLASLGLEMTAEAFLFRNRFGRPWRDDALADDFAALREIVFPGDKRQMRDMRRSGAVEMIVGGGKAEHLASKLANGVDQAGVLWKTYVPVDKAAVVAADDARRRGRAALRANESEKKLGTPQNGVPSGKVLSR